jgi:hypothetical protein
MRVHAYGTQFPRFGMVTEDDLKQLDPETFLAVHSRIGLALWHSQALEDALCYHITLVLKMPVSKAEVEVREVLEKMQSKTLGALIAELRKGNTALVSEFESRLDQFLKDRNWLVHKSWRQHHGDLYEPQRVIALVARLNAMANEALELQLLFAQIGHEWALQQGVSPESLEKHTRRILAERGAM